MKEEEAILIEIPSTSAQSGIDPCRFLADAVRDRALFLIDPNGIVTTWNPGGEEIYGYKADEIIGQHISCLYTPEVVSSGDLDELLRALPDNGPCEAEELQVRRGGWVFRGNVTISPLRDPSGAHVGFAVSVGEHVRESPAGAAIDIEEHQKIERALLESEEGLRRLLENIPDPVVVFKRDLRVQYVNEAMRQMTGLSTSDLSGRREMEILSPESREACLPTLRESFETGMVQSLEADLLAANGRTRHFRFTCIPLPDEQEGIREVVGIARDLTEGQRAEEAQRQRAELQSQLAKIAASVPGAIYSFLMSPDGACCMPSSTLAVVDLFGIPQETLARDCSPLFAAIHPDDVDRVRGTIAEAAKAPSHWHDRFRYLHPVRGLRWIEGWSVPRRQPDGGVLWHGFLMDITERREADDLLTEEATRWRVLMEQSRDAMVILDGDGMVIDANSRFAEMLGYSADEVLALRLSDWDDQATRDDGPDRLPEDDPTETWVEKRYRRKDGTYAGVEVRSTAAVCGGRQLMFCTCRDREPLQSAQEEAPWGMEEIGRLGGLARDFNNLLTVVQGNCELLLTLIPPGDPRRLYLGEIRDANDRAAALTRQLLDSPRSPGSIPLDGGGPATRPDPGIHMAPQDRETVLLVEPEEGVRRISRLVLESHGYRVVEARDARSAIEIAEMRPDSIDLLLTDVATPDIGGRSLVEILRDRLPELNVILTTGDADDPAVRSGIRDESAAILRKPFSPGQLANKVRKVLSANR